MDRLGESGETNRGFHDSTGTDCIIPWRVLGHCKQAHLACETMGGRCLSPRQFSLKLPGNV